MREAVDYAVAQMRKEGFILDPVVSRNMVRYMLDFISNELVEGRPFTFVGFGTFTPERKVSEKKYMPMLGREVITRPNVKVKFEPSKRFKIRLRGELDAEAEQFNREAIKDVRAKNPLFKGGK